MGSNPVLCLGVSDWTQFKRRDDSVSADEADAVYRRRTLSCIQTTMM